MGKVRTNQIRTALALPSALLLSAAMALSTQAQDFKSLYSFTGQNDGGGPSSPLFLDDTGTLYGAANTSANGFGGGTIFKLAPKGKFFLLYAFAGQGGHGTGGAGPLGGFIRDANGHIFDVTEFGGVENEYGVVFELSAKGKELVLHTFARPPNDGAIPLGPVLAGTSGAFYGTASFGGNGNCRGGCGIVFGVDSTGHENTIYNFQGGMSDGIEPWGNLVQDAQGNIYGVTMGGGPPTSPKCGPPFSLGCGTIFKLSPKADGSWTESILYSFTGLADGSDPDWLAIDTKGNIYGAALFNGSNRCPGGCGTVFKLDPMGRFSVLHSFVGGSEGFGPYGVVVDSKGTLYGSTNGGNPSCGQFGCGNIFKLEPNGTLTVLHKFNGTDGGGPGIPILDEKTGTLYDTTARGGASGWGTIFQLKP